MFLNLAKKLCQKSGHSQHHHGAIVTVGGAIVSVGYNHGNIHAEVHALNKLWGDHRKDVRVYSFRFTKSGKWAMAKPCPNCEKYMRDCGVRIVYYTDRDGNLTKMRL